MKKALILNDTSIGSDHFGCMRVMRNLRKALSERNIEVVSTIPVGTSWKNFPGIYEIINSVDLIIINGEGTIHNGRKKAEDLLSIVDALPRKMPFLALLNAIYENNPREWAAYLSKFDLIVTRDGRSADQIANLIGRKINHLPDFSMCTNDGVIDRVNINRINFLIGDSVSWSSTKKLFKYADELDLSGFNVFKAPMTSGFSPEIKIKKFFGERYSNLWRNRFLKINNNLKIFQSDLEYMGTLQMSDMHVTGRFHSVCLSVVCRTPFYSISSNTNKIQNLIDDIGLSSQRIIPASELNCIDNPYKFTYSEDELSKINDYLVRGRQEYNKTFDQLSCV